MKNLERRYEAWLRLYPKSYRIVHGDEILGTLLEANPHRRLPALDLLYLVMHAFRVRLRLMVHGSSNGPLPQPVRLVTWILNGLAVIALLAALFSHHGPKNPGPNGLAIFGTIALFGLSIMVVAHRRFLYLFAIAVLTLFACCIVVASQLGLGAVLAAPVMVLVALLAVGWPRYVAAIRVARNPPNQRKASDSVSESTYT